MQPSPRETAFLVTAGLEHIRAQIRLTKAGQPFYQPPELWIRILGVPMHEDEGAHAWIRQLKNNRGASSYIWSREGAPFPWHRHTHQPLELTMVQQIQSERERERKKNIISSGTCTDCRKLGSGGPGMRLNRYSAGFRVQTWKCAGRGEIR